MKALGSATITIVYPILTGCTSTVTFHTFDESTMSSLASARFVKLELADGQTLMATNLLFEVDSLSFAVAAEGGFPPARDFRGYKTKVSLADVVAATVSRDKPGNVSPGSIARGIRTAAPILAIPAVFTPLGAFIVAGATRSEAVDIADMVLQIVDFLDPPKSGNQDLAPIR